MTKRVTGLDGWAFLVGVLKTATCCQAATGEKSQVSSRLVMLAAAQFPNLTKAEHAMQLMANIDEPD